LSTLDIRYSSIHIIVMTYFAGLEEVVARLFGVIFAVIGFSVYAGAKGTITFDTAGFALVLIYFVVVYDVVSYLLYLLFKFFENRNSNKLADNNSSKIIDSK
jgi:hypothetical protein